MDTAHCPRKEIKKKILKIAEFIEKYDLVLVFFLFVIEKQFSRTFIKIPAKNIEKFQTST